MYTPTSINAHTFYPYEHLKETVSKITDPADRGLKIDEVTTLKKYSAFYNIKVSNMRFKLW
jgi:hypothetical protein